MFSRGFLGSTPSKLIESIIRVARPQDWSACYVACSGMFRIEAGLAARAPGLPIHSNDVSLLSSAIGFAATGQALPFRFKGDLGFVEDFGFTLPSDRIAALLIALNFSSYVKGKTNRFKQGHVAHLREHFPEYVTSTRPAVERLIATPIASYTGGDLRDHINAAIAAGAGVISYPPTFSGGYEKLFAFLNENTEWEAPAYRLFDPEKDVPGLVEKLSRSGLPFFLCCDQLLPGIEPATLLEQKGARPIYGYTHRHGSSYRGPRSGGKAFRYKPVDLAKVHKRTKLRAVPVPEAMVSFLRETYLKRGIAFGTGDFGTLIYLDDMLAGAVSYKRSMRGPNDLYVLTDLATTREGRIAKMIARAATCRAVFRPFELRMVRRYKTLLTTAFSEFPEAMKYRGSWEIVKRDEVNARSGRYAINYASEVRSDTLDDVFRWWWDRDGKKQVEAARNRDQDGRPA